MAFQPQGYPGRPSSVQWYNPQGMPRLLNRLYLGLKALRELGPGQLSLYALYQLGLRSGHYRRVTPPPTPSTQPYPYPLQPVLDLPDPAQLIGLLGETGLSTLRHEADEILALHVRLFGNPPIPLMLAPPAPLRHWTEYEGRAHGLGDLKFIWEPARFGWAFTLGRAYWLTRDERYPEAFWRYLEIFLAANPPYLGPNWISAQEVALRLCAYVFAAQVFAASPHTTPARLSHLAESVALHAARIPPTLVYARAQNNNHLISEALGLYTAAAALPDHPQAHKWQRSGWRWLNQAFQSQIAPDGAYCQHSTNYHRLMLQAAVWAHAVQKTTCPSQSFPPQTLARLQAAVSWLLALLDPISGQVPNLGPNDGASIFPLSNSPFNDYRATLQASAQAFFQKPALPSGIWDEAGLWLSPLSDRQRQPSVLPDHRLGHSGQTVLHGAAGSWAYLRAARFNSRPGHADQLHLDLWWQGMNLCLDPGTYRYTADPPWNNALTSTLVHNTLSVDGREQMTRAGRFLYLDWAQARLIEHSKAPDGSWERLCASHTGYRKLGITHQRQVTAFRTPRWLIEDTLSGTSRSVHHARLHWLVPDWPWEVDLSAEHLRVSLVTPHGNVTLTIQVDSGQTPEYALVRSGQLVWGHAPVHPTWGWTSPSYGDRIPVLAIIVQIQGRLPLQITSEWNLPNETIETTRRHRPASK